jgi:hypothetical protein
VKLGGDHVMLGASPRQRPKPIAGSSDRPIRASNPMAPQRPPASPVADVYGRFLELPVPAVLAALWLLGAVFLSAIVTTAYLAAAAIL